MEVDEVRNGRRRSNATVEGWRRLVSGSNLERGVNDRRRARKAEGTTRGS